MALSPYCMDACNTSGNDIHTRKTKFQKHQDGFKTLLISSAFDMP